MSERYTVRYRRPGSTPCTLAAGARLSEHLGPHNSPLLFGCRDGICGTCLVEVDAIERGTLAAASDDEREVLALFAPGNPRARLACQIRLHADLCVEPLTSRT